MKGSFDSGSTRLSYERSSERGSDHLLPQLREHFGNEHWNVLSAEMEVSYTAGLICSSATEIKNAASQARKEFTRHAARTELLFGPQDEHTLAARHNRAFFTGRSGDPGTAVLDFAELLTSSVSFRGPLNAETLTVRHEIAYWTGEGGDTEASLRVFKDLLPDRTSVLGANHPRTLRNRFHIVRLSLNGDSSLIECNELIRDCLSALGPEDPLTREAVLLLNSSLP